MNIFNNKNANINELRISLEMLKRECLISI